MSAYIREGLVEPSSPTEVRDVDGVNGGGASRPFAPILEPEHWEMLRRLVSGGHGAPSGQLAAALRGSGLGLDGEREALAYRAACLVLADLVEQGWDVRIIDNKVVVTPPSAQRAPGETVAEAKARVRQGLLVWRDRQLALPSTREFIRRAEDERIVRRQAVSVLDLVDRGDELADELRQMCSLSTHEREGALNRVIRPVIQVCDPNSRCAETGLPLIDIWRYFRHTWSLEYRSVPGRSLPLLVRNAARPLAPVIGIAMLASPAVRLQSRDSWIGWYVDDVLDRVRSGEWAKDAVAAALLRSVRDALDEIRWDDLLRPEEVERPTEAAILRLEQVAEGAEVQHTHRLIELEEEFGSEAGRAKRAKPRTLDGRVDWRAASELPLFKAKRANALLRLLQARLAFLLADLDTRPEWGLAALFQTEHGKAAVSTALKETRKRALASQVAEVSVCGAVAPYTELLGGKLVALLLASREVRDMYRARYGEQVSDISSQVAGRPITRSGELMVLTTTSLYSAGSSQYNRLVLRSREHPEIASDVRWVEVGRTEGYGTVHLGAETVGALRTLSRAVHGARRVNNVFGEGASPRMRQLREGLDALGVESDRILHHASPRIVYACELVPGAREALVGIGPVPDPSEGASVSAIASAWSRRWLARRIESDEVMDRVAQLGPRTISEELKSSPASKGLLPLE